MVEWKKMWEITTWDKKFQGVDKSMQSHIIQYPYLLAKDLFALSIPNGNIKLLSTGVQEGWTTEEVAGEYICEGEVVSIPWGKSPGAKNPVKYYKGKFVTGDNRIATSTNPNVLNNKFLYYWLIKNSDLLDTFYRGAGIQHPSMYMVLMMDIPIPSLAEQTRIVGILDTFTASIDNLKEQIAERCKQYEHYHDKLLDLEGKEGVEMKTLGEVCNFVRGPFGGALKKEIFVKSGYSVYEQQHAIYGLWDFRYFIDSKTFEKMKRFEVHSGDIIMSCSGTMGKTSIIPQNHEPGIINQALLKLSVIPNINNRFIKLFMDSTWFQEGLKNKTAGGAIQNVASVSILKELDIAIPSHKDQSRIVSILDTFEASIQNLEAQLKEREKQYEYYRNKLLTFE